MSYEVTYSGFPTSALSVVFALALPCWVAPPLTGCVVDPSLWAAQYLAPYAAQHTKVQTMMSNHTYQLYVYLITSSTSLAISSIQAVLLLSLITLAYHRCPPLSHSVFVREDPFLVTACCILVVLRYIISNDMH